MNNNNNNKFLYFLLIAFVLINISFAFVAPPTFNRVSSFTAIVPTDSCEQTQGCAEEGDSCVGDLTSESSINCNVSSDNPNCCALGLYCINSTCAVDNVGSNCTIDDYCVGADLAACIKGVCVQQSLPGEICSSNSDCVYSSSVCNDSVCVGLKSGAACDMTEYACDQSLYCSNSICKPEIPSGGTCVYFQDICANGNICGYEGKCIEPFQGTSGSNCHYSEECTTDLVCTGLQKCTSFNSFDKISCSSTTDCPTGYQCFCDQITGDQLCLQVNSQNQLILPESYCGDYNQDLLSCMGENNCSYYYLKNYVGTLNPNSCPAQNCNSEYNDFMSCSCDVTEEIYGNCEGSQYCGGFPVWAIIVIVVVAVILVVVIIIVVVMCMRRRRNTYDHIA